VRAAPAFRSGGEGSVKATGDPGIRLDPVRAGDEEFRRRMAEYWGELGVDPAPLWAARYFRRIFAEQGKTRFTYWALADGERFGFCMVRLDPDGLLPERLVGYIAEFYVFPSHRRRGLGRALAHLLVRWLRERGAHSVELDVLPSNVRAQRFWESVGFVITYHHYRLGG
jgi:ribosomal protein S18 acetylase RimI-like enzyme